MKHSLLAGLLLIAIIPLTAAIASADNGRDTTGILKKQTKEYLNQHFEGQWFLGYRYSDLKNEEINKFTLKRSYITFKHKFNDRLDVRFTQDITLDTEGDDAGNIETRLKYCYLNVNLEDFAFVSDPYIEGGLVHRPWLDFEQKINHYRVQGTMFLERIGLFNSADFGFSFGGLLGGKVSENYRKEVNSKYPGKYGSFAIGVYNGAGYHALEKNNNKTLEGRLTLRPFPSTVPGLQISYNTAYGKGNNKMNPDFIINSGFLSFEARSFTLTAQYYKGRGNSKGSFADTLGNAYTNEGYSFFGEYKVPGTKFTVFARYDKFFCQNNKMLDNQRFIGGIGYYFYKNSKFIVDVDYFMPESPTLKDQSIFEAVIEIKF
jgi:hypothetical protein